VNGNQLEGDTGFHASHGDVTGREIERLLNLQGPTPPTATPVSESWPQVIRPERLINISADALMLWRNVSPRGFWNPRAKGGHTNAYLEQASHQ
jgi:hypothetical protein